MDEIPRIRKKVHFGGMLDLYLNFAVLVCNRGFNRGAFCSLYLK